MKTFLYIKVLTLAMVFSPVLMSNALACPKNQGWTIGIVTGDDAKSVEPGTSVDIGKPGSKCSFSAVEKGSSNILKSFEKINVRCNFESGAAVKGSAVYSVEKTGKEHLFPLMIEVTAGETSPSSSISITCVPD